MAPFDPTIVANTALLAAHLGKMGKSIYDNLVEINKEVPAVLGEGKNLRIQAPDNRLSWGIKRQDGKFVLSVLVERDDSRSLEIARRLSKDHGGVVLAPRVIGRAQSTNPSDKGRKRAVQGLEPGASIGHIRGYPGTIGCVVRSTKNKEDWIGVTSASHVLSINNTADEGDIIIAPGHPDGPKSNKARCGSLDRFIYLTHYSKSDRPGVNSICCPDVALVQLDPNARHEIPNTTWVLEPKSGAKRLRIKGILDKDGLIERSGEKVYKIGRSTGLTEGTLDIVGLQRQAISLPDNRLYLYTDVITVERSGRKSFSEAGDSGALVYTADGYGIGFIIGGTEDISFVSPMDVCLREIEAELLL